MYYPSTSWCDDCAGSFVSVLYLLLDHENEVCRMEKKTWSAVKYIP